MTTLSLSLELQLTEKYFYGVFGKFIFNVFFPHDLNFGASLHPSGFTLSLLSTFRCTCFVQMYVHILWP